MTTETAPAGELAALPTGLPETRAATDIPAGFVAAGATIGIKPSGRPDLAIVAVPAGPAAVAAVFTPNTFAAAPVKLSQAHLAQSEPAGNGRYGWTQAIVSTSGCANAATGVSGAADQAEICTALATALRIAPEHTLALSTGLIGTRLPVPRVVAGITDLVDGDGLRADADAVLAAAEGLRTTDSRPKFATVNVELPAADGSGTVTVRVTGIAKGVGMIHPRMATMLSIVMTDATAPPAALHRILRAATVRTWNQLTVDGDTSTNDTVFLVASGAAGAAPATDGSVAADRLAAAVTAVARDLARQQASDGEGATTLLTCQVSGGRDDADARAVARSVIGSSLLKAAVHGRDPNWGRIAGAIGNARLPEAAVLEAGGLTPDEAAARAGAPAAIDPDRVRIAIEGTVVFDGPAGGATGFSKEAVRAKMGGPETLIRIDLGLGDGTGEAFGCDLTEEYVRENSEYST
jgi:glutamate N-acetyltransferase/amino-acid N-acetyltransferase